MVCVESPSPIVSWVWCVGVMCVCVCDGVAMCVCWCGCVSMVCVMGLLSPPPHLSLPSDDVIRLPRHPKWCGRG